MIQQDPLEELFVLTNNFTDKSRTLYVTDDVILYLSKEDYSGVQDLAVRSH